MPDAAGRPRAAASPLAGGLAGLVLLFCALGVLHALATPPFLPADEQAHYGYALTVARGELPTIDTPIPPSASEELAARLEAAPEPNRDVWTANHPPLHPLLIAAPIAWGERTGRPVAGLVGARLVGVAAGAGGLLAVAWLGLQLLPGRPRTALLAAALVGTVPLVAHVSAFAYNDALALLTATAATATAAAALRRGPTRRLAIAAAVAALAAALTRASGLAAAAVAGAALLAAGAVHRAGGARTRLGAGVAAAAPAGLAVAAGAGWFYLRNLRRYGDPTGAAALFAKFDRTPREEGLGVLADPGFWRAQADQLYSGFAGQTSALGPTWIRLAHLVWAVVAIGLVLAAARAVAARRGPATSSAAPSRRLLPWAPPVAAAALLVVSVGRFVAAGGGPHPRYWLPVLPVLAVVAAVGVTALPGRRWALGPVVVVLAQTAIGLLAWGRFAVQRHPEATAEPWWAVPGAVLEAVGVPGASAVVALLAAAAAGGLALLCWGLLRARDPAT